MNMKFAPGNITNLVKPFSLVTLSKLGLNKRQKIIVSAIVMTSIFLFATQTTNVVFGKYQYILIVGLISYLASIWALWTGITKTKALLLFILPVFYCVAFVGYYFIFKEVRWLTRLPTALFFGLFFYFLLLAQNVFNISSDRTIPLYRAASTVNFVFTVFTAVLIYSVILTLNLPFYWNGVLVFLISFPLILQSLWAVKMENISAIILVYSICISMIIAQGAVALSFWPIAPTIWGVSLATFLYILLGIFTESLRDRLSRRVVMEYLAVGVIVVIFSLSITSWVN